MCLGARVQEFLIRLEYLLLLSHRVTHLGTSLVAQWLKEKKKKNLPAKQEMQKIQVRSLPREEEIP